MANLTSQQIKDSYQSVITTSETTSDPTTGTIQNGKGSPFTALTLNGILTAIKMIFTSGGTATGTGIYSPTANNLAFSTSDTERGRFDQNGNFVIGATSTGFTSGTGMEIERASNNATLRLQRITSSTSSLELRAGASQAELYSVSGVPFLFGANNTARLRIETTGVVNPNADATQTLGSASLRWSEVFASNGTINTSDQNSKTDIEALNQAELAVAVALKGLVKKYRFQSAVAEKGDDARIHVGLIAQDVEQAFIANGLDAKRYGVFCRDVWYTRVVEHSVDGEIIERTEICGEDEEGAVRHEQLGLRYDQVWAFIISAL